MLFRHQSGKRPQFQLLHEIHRIIDAAQAIYGYFENDETKNNVKASQVDRALSDYKMMIDRLLADEAEWSKAKSDKLAAAMIENPELYRLNSAQELAHWAWV
jgi:predicted aminopeptidase